MDIYDIFISAINQKKIVEVTFDATEKGVIKRKCIPFDFGPSRRNLNPNPDRYHFFDLDSPDGKHNLSILPEQIHLLELTDEAFEPGDYITWNTNWFVPRDWDSYS